MPRKKRRGRNSKKKKEAAKAASSPKSPAPPTPPAAGSSPAQNASAAAHCEHNSDKTVNVHDQIAALNKHHPKHHRKATQDVSASNPSASKPMSSGAKESKCAPDAVTQKVESSTAALADDSAPLKAKQGGSASKPDAATPEPSADKIEGEEPPELYKVTLGVTPEQVKGAHDKFRELDTDQSGSLQGPEMKKLADWICSSLHKGNAMDADHKHRKDHYGRKLMESLDTNGDGELSFSEFVGWFAETSKNIDNLKDAEALTEQFDSETQAPEAERKSEDAEGGKDDPYAAVSEFWEAHQKKHSELVEQGQKNLKTLKAKIENRTIARIQLLKKESEEVLGAARDHLARVQKTKADGEGSEVLDNAETFYMSQITEVTELLEKLGAKISRIEKGEWLSGMGSVAPESSEADKL